MGKLALTIRRQDLLVSNTPGCAVHPIPTGFFNLPVALADRDTCETDEQTLQLIPYIVLRSPTGEAFVYARGKAGEEARLHGNLSLGLGGHVDHLPDGPSDSSPAGESLLSLLQREGAREYMEEASGVLAEPLVFVGLIVDNTNPVGRVHLGLLCFVEIQHDQLLTLEPDVIENGLWLQPRELLEEPYVARLENWTRAVVDHLMIHRKQ